MVWILVSIGFVSVFLNVILVLIIQCVLLTLDDNDKKRENICPCCVWTLISFLAVPIYAGMTFGINMGSTHHIHHSSGLSETETSILFWVAVTSVTMFIVSIIGVCVLFQARLCTNLCGFFNMLYHIFMYPIHKFIRLCLGMWNICVFVWRRVFVSTVLLLLRSAKALVTLISILVLLFSIYFWFGRSGSPELVVELVNKIPQNITGVDSISAEVVVSSNIPIWFMSVSFECNCEYKASQHHYSVVYMSGSNDFDLGKTAAFARAKASIRFPFNILFAVSKIASNTETIPYFSFDYMDDVVNLEEGDVLHCPNENEDKITLRRNERTERILQVSRVTSFECGLFMRNLNLHERNDDVLTFSFEHSIFEKFFKHAIFSGEVRGNVGETVLVKRAGFPGSRILLSYENIKMSKDWPLVNLDDVRLSVKPNYDFVAVPTGIVKDGKFVHQETRVTLKLQILFEGELKFGKDFRIEVPLGTGHGWKLFNLPFFGIPLSVVASMDISFERKVSGGYLLTGGLEGHASVTSYNGKAKEFDWGIRSLPSSFSRTNEACSEDWQISLNPKFSLVFGRPPIPAAKFKLGKFLMGIFKNKFFPSVFLGWDLGIRGTSGRIDQTLDCSCGNFWSKSDGTRTGTKGDCKTIVDVVFVKDLKIGASVVFTKWEAKTSLMKPAELKPLFSECRTLPQKCKKEYCGNWHCDPESGFCCANECCSKGRQCCDREGYDDYGWGRCCEGECCYHYWDTLHPGAKGWTQASCCKKGEKCMKKGCVKVEDYCGDKIKMCLDTENPEITGCCPRGRCLQKGDGRYFCSVCPVSRPHLCVSAVWPGEYCCSRHCSQMKGLLTDNDFGLYCKDWYDIPEVRKRLGV